MDPISDMFIRIKNAQRAGHNLVRVSHSKFKYEIAKALERAQMIGVVEKKGKRVKKTIEIPLLNRNGKPAVTGIFLFSKPGRRLYAGVASLHEGRKGGVTLLSTPKGVLTAHEAKKEHVGGMLIAEIW